MYNIIYIYIYTYYVNVYVYIYNANGIELYGDADGSFTHCMVCILYTCACVCVPTDVSYANIIVFCGTRRLTSLPLVGVFTFVHIYT